MKKIALVAAKGSVGKTSLAAGLATGALLAPPDAEVALVDLDPQGSLTGWWNTRALPQPTLYEVAETPLQRAKSDLRRVGKDVVVIDRPPGFSLIHQRVIEVADLVLIPTGASPLDTAAVEAAAERVERVERVERAGVPFGYVPNRTMCRSRLAAETTLLLCGWRGRSFPPLHHWVAIPTAMIGGRTALELNAGCQAAREFAALWAAVDALFLGLPPPSARGRRRPGR